MGLTNRFFRDWISDRLRMIIVVLAVFLTFFLSAGFLCYEHERTTTERFLKEDLANARLLSLLLEEHLQKITKTMESYSRRPLLIKAVKEKNAYLAKGHLADLVKNNPDIDIVIITDRAGTLWTAYPDRPKEVGMNFSYREWYKEISKHWKPYISNLVLRVSGEKDAAIQVCVPVADTKGNITGIMLNTQRTIELSRIIKQVKLDPGTYVNIADRKGMMVYSSRFAFDKALTPYPFYSVLGKSKDGTVAIEDPYEDGRKRYISFAPAASTGWTIFIGRSSRSIIMSEFSYYVQILIIAFLLFAVFVVSIFYFRKQMMSEQLKEQIKAEASLREERQQSQMYLDTAGVIMAALDTEGCITMINKKGCDVLGHQQQDIVGFNWFDLFLPEDIREEVKGVFRKLMDGNIVPVEYYENPVQTKGGESRTIAFHNALIRDQSSRITGILFSGEDITERKKAEAALLGSERRLRELIDFLPDATLAVDSEKKIIVWNKAIERMTGIKAEEMIGKGDYEYTLPFYGVRRPQLMDLMWESRQDIIEKYPQVTSDGESLSAEAFCNALYGGRGAHVFARVSPLHDNDGNIVGAIESIRDITVSKKMQQLIEAKNRELEQMLYIASHDLRSPLVNIDGYGRELEFSVRELRQALDMAPESLSEFTKVAQSHMQDITGALQYIRNSTTQMDALLKGILKLSRSGRASLSIGPLNMNELVAGVISAIEFQIREKGVDLHVSELPPCVGDAVQVTQVFSNLLGNALKYLDQGNAGSIGIDGIIKDGRSIYCVEDNGIGIDLAHQEKIFEVFHRLEPSKSEGEGLGLTIVRQILSRIDGDIWLESKPGEGSRFYVALPAAPEKGKIN